LNPSVSVVVPAYNSERTIRRAIESVLTQTVSPLEILVVDDGSKEYLQPHLMNFGPRVTVIRKENGGASSARNLGIDRARGTFVAFLDADDYWEPTKLEKQLVVFAENHELILVAGRYFAQVPGKTRREEPLVNVPLDVPTRQHGAAAYLLATQVWTGTVMIRRELLGSLRFISGLEPAEDRDLWIRLIESGPVYLLSVPLATQVHEPHSLSRSNITRAYGNSLKVVQRHRETIGGTAALAFEREIYRRWAGALLHRGERSAARQPAWERLKRQPLSAEAWWVLGQSFLQKSKRSEG